jgi:hypothetical protein
MRHDGGIHGGAMVMETTMVQRPYYSQFDMIIYVHVMFTFLPYYFICALHVVDVLSW